MAGFNLDDYEPVASRIARFVERYPEGAIHTEIVFDDGVRVVVKASVYRTIGDPIPAGVDYAEEILADRGVNLTSRVENCATSATGRCLSLIGFASADWTKKPSREEMSKAARSNGVAPSSSGPARLASDKQRGFIRRLAFERGLKDTQSVEEAIAAALGLDADTIRPLDLLTPAEASRVIDTWQTGN